MPSNFYSQFVSNLVVFPTPPTTPAPGNLSLIYGPVPASQVAVIFGLSVSNRNNSPIGAYFYTARGTPTVLYSLIFNAVVPVGSSLVVAGNDQKIVLQAGDSLYGAATSAGYADVICSLLVQS